MHALLAVLAVLADALADLSARVTYAALAVALVFTAAQISGGAPVAETVNTVGWVALALATARLAFTAARALLAEYANAGGSAGAVTT